MTTKLETQVPEIRETFELIMGVFEKVSGGRPIQGHQEAIVAALERLWDDAYANGVEADRRPW